MDLDSIKITPKSFEDICTIMNTNYGDVNWQSFKSSEEFIMYCTTLIQASYKIGFRDGKE
jgi:hypothetical protein